MRSALQATLALAALGLFGACEHRQEPVGIELLGGWRPGSARLAGFDWAAPGTEALETSRARGLRLLARELDSERDPTRESLRLRALLRLASGDVDGAIRGLERARSLFPEDRTLALDLVASRLERSRRGHRWRDLFGAIELLDEIGDGGPEARFLRAQSLDRLGLRASARSAWRRVLEESDSPGWKGEAAARLAVLEQPTSEALWRRARTESIASEAPAELGVDSVAARFSGLAHDDLFYGGLAAWGRLELAGDPAGASAILALARRVGSRLLERGDQALAAAVAAIDGATGARRAALARGHTHLEAGWTAFDCLEVASARSELENAERELCASGSPACAWARYWAGLVRLYDGRFPELESRFRALEARWGRALDPRLRASLERTRGTVALRSADFTAARDHYQRAAAGFDALGDRFNFAVLQTYLADVDSSVGHADSDWRRRLAAVAALQQTPSSPWLATALYGSALSALAAGSPAAALAFIEEDRIVLSALPRFRVDQAEAALLRASLQMRLGDPAGAASAIATARHSIQEIPDPTLRRRLEADFGLQLARFELDRDPSAAMRAARRAASGFRDLGVRLPAIEIALLEARAALALGRVESARAGLQGGFHELTAVLAGLDDPFVAASYLELSGDLVDELASLEAEAYGRPEIAFELLEALRGPGRRGADHATTPIIAPPTEAIVSFALLPHRLLIAVRTGSARKTAAVSVSRVELESKCQRLFALLTTGATDAAIRTETDWLSSRLIAPIAKWLPQGSELVIVADRALHLVPFAALHDPRNGAYLVEEHAIRYASSEREGAGSGASDRRPPRTPSRVTVLAPAAGSAEGVALPALPAARAEARSVAALYPGARLLEGVQANRGAFLSALRDSDILHFAGHAQAAPEDPGASRLWLADERDARRLSPLLAADLLRSERVGPALVVLSGCETSLPASRRRLGSDGYAGSLLATGARAVLGTAWAVDDMQAESLFVSFHRHLITGLGAAEALRRAQLDRIRSAASHDRSPAQWAFARLNGE